MCINNGILGAVLGIVFQYTAHVASPAAALMLCTVIHAGYNVTALLLMTYEAQLKPRLVRA